jgi:hypothetical protein
VGKARVAIWGTTGKSILIDTDLGPRITALEARITALGTPGANILHSSLQGLQIGDDHPQYTMWQAPETIKALWNFDTIPEIQGETLAEYIEDVVGGSFAEFLIDTSSVVWTYHDSAQELEANVPPEFVQDVVGAMLTDTTSIDLSYNDAAGTFQAAIIDEYVQDLVGAMLVDTATVDFTYDDALGQISATVPGAALTKTDDTNVTLTLGGSSTTALARAASLTLGWTGQLSVPRGGSGAATLTGYLKGNGTSAFTAVSTIPYSDISGTPTIPTGANPSASVGLTAVNGSAATFMRSDGAPAIDQSIAPSWSSLHTFTKNGSLASNGSSMKISANPPYWEMQHTGAAADSGRWVCNLTSVRWQWFTLDDAGTTAKIALRFSRVANAVTDVEFGNTTDNPTLTFSTSARATYNGVVRLKGYTVATLPAGTVGDTAYVTDALTPVSLATVVGGGAVKVPVFYDGTNWIVQ